MRVTRHLGVLFFVIAAMNLQVCAEGIKQSGIVTDEQLRTRIAGANVSAAGGQAIRDAITDVKGTFILPLVEGVKSGDTIRIRVQKTGYLTYDEQVPVSVEVPLQISLVPLKKAHASSTAHSPGGESTPTVAPPISPTPKGNIREHGLTLSKDILDFLAERQRNDPHPQQVPGFHASSDGGADIHNNSTPPFMSQTLVLFAQKFESRIADIRDEFSSRCLKDSSLNALHVNPEHNIFGNSDAAIREMGESIRKLALLFPPEGLYNDTSDARLAEMAIEEVGTMDDKAQKAIDGMQAISQDGATQGTLDFKRFLFWTDFRDCCLDQVEYLRADILKRLGPSACDSYEMRSFNGPGGVTEMEKNPSGSIATVLDYVPHFRRPSG
jgi:hypothetical protein